jgi:hypothetical protein
MMRLDRVAKQHSAATCGERRPRPPRGRHLLSDFNKIQGGALWMSNDDQGRRAVHDALEALPQIFRVQGGEALIQHHDIGFLQ